VDGFLGNFVIAFIAAHFEMSDVDRTIELEGANLDAEAELEVENANPFTTGNRGIVALEFACLCAAAFVTVASQARTPSCRNHAYHAS